MIRNTRQKMTRTEVRNQRYFCGLGVHQVTTAAKGVEL